MFSACASQPLQLVQPYLEPANSFFWRIISLLMEMVVSNHFPCLNYLEDHHPIHNQPFHPDDHQVPGGQMFNVSVFQRSRLRHVGVAIVTTHHGDRHRTSWEIDLSPPWTAPSIRITFPPAAPFMFDGGLNVRPRKNLRAGFMRDNPKKYTYFVIFRDFAKCATYGIVIYGSKHRANGVHTHHCLSGTLPRCVVS